MATIFERKNDCGQVIGYQAKVCRRGFPAQSKTFDRKADAERWARKIENEMDEGHFVSRTAAEQTTLGELVDRYREEVTPSHKGAKQEHIRLAGMRKHPIASRFVATLKSKDFAEWRNERLEVVSAATTIRELNLRHAVIETARREWGINLHDNPVHLVRRPRAEAVRERRFEGDEERRLLAACDADNDPWMGPIVRIAIETAMRQGEICGLLWADVDLGKSIAVLHDPKNGEMRVVPLSSRARAVLETLPRSVGGRVFPVDQEAFKVRFRRTCARAGIKGLRFQDLRHEATSRFFEMRLPMMEVAAITGHKTLAMLKRYTHMQAVDLAKKLG